jgi:hypothetical protein
MEARRANRCSTGRKLGRELLTGGAFSWKSSAADRLQTDRSPVARLRNSPAAQGPDPGAHRRRSAALPETKLAGTSISSTDRGDEPACLRVVNTESAASTGVCQCPSPPHPPPGHSGIGSTPAILTRPPQEAGWCELVGLNMRDVFFRSAARSADLASPLL